MKKILFLHGFYASGQCVPAIALREAFAGRADVLTPDLPMHPQDALCFIRELTDRQRLHNWFRRTRFRSSPSKMGLYV